MDANPFFQLETLHFEDQGNGQQRHVMHLEGMSAMFVRMSKGFVGDANHRHPQEQIAYIVQGVVRMFVGNQSAILKAGSGYRVPANVPHHLEALEDTLVMDCFSPKREDLPATAR